MIITGAAKCARATTKYIEHCDTEHAPNAYQTTQVLPEPRNSDVESVLFKHANLLAADCLCSNSAITEQHTTINTSSNAAAIGHTMPTTIDAVSDRSIGFQTEYTSTESCEARTPLSYSSSKWLSCESSNLA